MSPVHCLPPEQRTTQVVSNVSIVDTSPLASVIPLLGLKVPVTLPLVENSKKSGIPGMPAPVAPNAVAVKTNEVVQLAKYCGSLGDRVMEASWLVARVPQQAAGSNAPGLHLRPPSGVMHVVPGFTSEFCATRTSV